MSDAKNWPPSSDLPFVPPHGSLIKSFGSLKVRYKLAILHNLFFFSLAVAVYLCVIPVFSRHIIAARERELRMVSQIFAAELPLSSEGLQTNGLSAYLVRHGSAEELGLSREGRSYLAIHPSGTWKQEPDSLFRNDGRVGSFRQVKLSVEFYQRALRQARISLFVVLGSIYLLSIIMMELFILPRFVYVPLQLMLRADDATQRDDRLNELIDEEWILDDEIGQIMRSRNVTVAQLRRQEDSLATALQKLEEQDRLVSLGLLSTSVAHELNTPLAVLQGSIEKILETSNDRATLERLARMLRVTQRLRRISEGLVDFARVRKQENEPVSLRPIIEESWSLVGIDEKASAISFSNQVKDDATVVGNADRLVQVFVNLLRNALLAVHNGGTVVVQSKLVQRSGHNWISCVVMDNGPGIPPSILPNLFEAFVSTRLDAKGTGLGLTVAEGIVTQHGGVISAANRAEGGACLEVVLPSAC